MNTVPVLTEKPAASTKPLLVYAANNKQLPEGVTVLIHYLVCQLGIDASLKIDAIELSQIESIETLESHDPGVLIRQCSNPNHVGMAVKTLDSRGFVFHALAFDSEGKEIINSKFLASILSALSGAREMYVTAQEIESFQKDGFAPRRQVTSCGGGEKKPKGLLPVVNALSEFLATESPATVHASYTIPEGLPEVDKIDYLYEELLKGLRERSLGGKDELSFAEVMQVAVAKLLLPRLANRYESLRFMRKLLKLRFVKRIGKELPAKYKVIGYSYDSKRGVARLRPALGEHQNEDSIHKEESETVLGIGRQVEQLQTMAEKFRGASDEIQKVRDELEKLDNRLKEYNQDQARITAIKMEVRKLHEELKQLHSKPNFRGIHTRREAFTRQLSILQEILNTPAYKSAEEKLKQLEAIMAS